MHDIDRLLGALVDGFEGIPGLTGHLDAAAHVGAQRLHAADGTPGFVENGGYGGRDFLRGQRGSFGKLAYFVGHHGKPPALLTGPRRLDRRVERQKIRLIRDFADHTNHA
ncbi:hypothetical protein SDC9_210900 [bioreactor metagenome]|uniref:Uncharacterized protein n=1 Tax=bioreactor metagenome TaxID=1076179 RepID=A0A645JI87_9ZZZZ